MIGGAAGAVPVLVGWSAVTNSLAWPPIILFAVIFIWTPPHFWALAVRYRDDYEAVDVPMLPVVASMERTTLEILDLLGGARRVDHALRGLGPPGCALRHRGHRAQRRPSCWMAAKLYLKARRGEEVGGPEAMRLFHFSITYLTVLFVAMAADVLVRNLVHSH